jgi:5-methylcytosine-specific restriction endonuclease McrA
MIALAIDHRAAAAHRMPGTRGARAGRRPLLMARPERLWCAYCAMPAETWDHVEPWSRSRDNSGDNLVPACVQCNQDKGDLALVVFLALTAPEGAPS